MKRQRKFGSVFIISRKAIDLKKRICRPYSFFVPFEATDFLDEVKISQTFDVST